MGKGRVVVAMSGGVDSSVSAHLLVQAGYDVVGVFMRTGAHAEDDHCETTPRKIRGCCSAIDAGDAQRVADRLNIPFYALDFAEDFDRIKDYFVEEYLNARTPNPCVVCNTWLKFGKLWDYAQAVNADYIATGHYARCSHDHGTARLLRGLDPGKDQSYFLFGLDYAILQRVLFPIGNMEKSAVRALAAEHDLGVQSKPDSQEICFVPDGDHHRFIQAHRPELIPRTGEVVDSRGTVVGTHPGISKFTIGQRKGLGIAMGTPHYVVELDPEANRVVIGSQELLLRPSLYANRVNWLMGEPPRHTLRCTIKIRYLHRAAAGLVTPLDEDRVLVEFDAPQSAITPGQAAVFHDNDHVLGGAWIE